MVTARTTAQDPRVQATQTNRAARRRKLGILGNDLGVPVSIQSQGNKFGTKLQHAVLGSTVDGGGVR